MIKIAANIYISKWTNQLITAGLVKKKIKKKKPEAPAPVSAQP